jgi:drug/metabolite transporter (DMT)-like permease
MAGLSKPTRITVAFVFVIVIGTLLEIKGELHATALGLFLMFTSVVCDALAEVVTQKFLHDLKFTVVETMYVLAPPGAFLLLLAAMPLELPDMMSKGDHVVLLQHPMWFFSAVILGGGVNFVGFMVVQATSSLTCKILNIVRCTSLVFVGVLWYGETISPIAGIGYTVALVGLLGYNFAQVAPEQASKVEKAFEDGCCPFAKPRVWVVVESEESEESEV